MTLQRYECEVIDEDGDCWREMVKDDGGEWVRFKDVEAKIERFKTIIRDLCTKLNIARGYVASYDYDLEGED